MLPSTPHASATAKSISPFATRYPAGGMTSSLGSGSSDDSTAIRTTIPGYPRSRNRSSSQWTKDSSIEAVFSEQGDEARRAERGVAQLAGRLAALHQGERLGAAHAERDQQAASGRELLHQRGRYVGTPRGDEDRVVGRIGAPAERPVAQQHRDVADEGLAQRALGRERERLHPLHREHGRGERGEQRRLISRTGADFEHPLLSAEPQGLEVAGLRVRLRDGLP